jgi:hypothetical protein
VRGSLDDFMHKTLNIVEVWLCSCD